MIKKVDMFFEFMNTIPRPPMDTNQMHNQACSSDNATVNRWRQVWLDNTKANKERFGSFRDHSIAPLFQENHMRPGICVGSGPSLANNIQDLRAVKGIPIVSCLHNYHYMVDNEVPVKYFVTLDAGDVTLEEISEGGQKSHQEYLDSTKDKTLLAYIGSSPKLLAQWKGDVKFYSCPMPEMSLVEDILKIEEFNIWVSTGGNVLGACVYISKAIMGSNPIAFVGADFSFSYTRQFHAWKSKYDKELGQVVPATDVFGHRVLTWQSYYNFKVYFEWLAQIHPGIYINCTEGGILGSYPEGNIAQIRQMALKDLNFMYNVSDTSRITCEKPDVRNLTIAY